MSCRLSPRPNGQLFNLPNPDGVTDLLPPLIISVRVLRALIGNARDDVPAKPDDRPRVGGREGAAVISVPEQ